VTTTRVPALGPRGEGWVALQTVVLVAAGVAGIIGAPWAMGARTALLVAGVAVAVGGGTLGAAGIRHLGSSLTAFPMPVDGASMRDAGPYRLVRHPIYGGLLLVTLGWAAATSPVALAPAAALGAIFEGKRRREEAWLAQRHPGYVDYMRRVRHRFVPFVW
jgi:protein-S-isoprenylcysteine O-methyltransferase Ste14